MQVRARLKNFRMSSKKARKVADLVRGKKTDEAFDQLIHLKNKLSAPLVKLINSAIFNGANNFGISKKNLYIEEIKVDEGPVMKRWMPRAHGRAYPIFKRSSHIELILNEIEEGKDRVKVEKKEAKTVSYKELKKVMEDADKVLKNKGKKAAKGKANKNDKSADKAKTTKGKVSKFFRRKSI